MTISVYPDYCKLNQLIGTFSGTKNMLYVLSYNASKQQQLSVNKNNYLYDSNLVAMFGWPV